MEMEIEEKHSSKLEINETDVTKSATIYGNECKVHATMVRKNNTQAKEASFLEISDKFPYKIHEFEDFQEPQYNGFDQYVCSECNIPKPSARLLDIHVQEVHDSFFKILAERQPMYECYVSECALKFNNPSQRRKHCISEHKYSKSFRFVEDRNKITGLERVSGKLKEDPTVLNKNSTKSEKRKNFEEGLENYKRKAFHNDLDTSSPPLDESNSALVFIPRQVALQNSYVKILENNESLTREILENECMMDLADH